MKILFLCEFYDPKLSYQENHLAKKFYEKGYEVVVLTSTITSVFDFIENNACESIESTENIQGIKVIRKIFKGFFYNRIKYFPDFDKTLKNEKPDIIFSHGILLNFFQIVSFIKNKKNNIRFIVDCHSDESNSGRSILSLLILHKIIRRILLKFSLKYIDKLYGVTPSTIKFMAKNYGIPIDSIRLLPLGVDLNVMKKKMLQMDRIILRNNHGVRPDSLIIFTGGKLTHKKNIETLISAVNLLHKEDIFLFIVGASSNSIEDSRYVDKLKALAFTNSKIIFTGWLAEDDVLSYLNMSDIAVFPGTQSILWQTAIGMGKPLIVYGEEVSPGGAQDISYMNIYENITIVKSVEDLKDKINLLFFDRKLVKKLSNLSHRVGCEFLDWDRLTEEIIN